MEKIISVVIPTLNRSEYIIATLEHWREQIRRNEDKVELIVCNNGSSDNTAQVLTDYHDKNDFFEFVDFQECVEIEKSFERTIAKAAAKYIILWGDDDLPFPYLIDILLGYIDKYPDCGLFHFNRLTGYDKIESLCNLRILKNEYSTDVIEYSNVDEFISGHLLDATFISSLMFPKESMTMQLDTSRHYGYNFIVPIYYGAINRRCIYINYPLCIQRMPIKRAWAEKSPLYRMIGLPNALFDMEKLGIIKDAQSIWMQQANSTKDFWAVMLQAARYRKFYRTKCRQINKYQYSIRRKIYVYLIVYLFPDFIYDWSKYVFRKKVNY